MVFLLLACITVSVGAQEAYGEYSYADCTAADGGFWYWWVSSSGPPVTGPTLENGRIYYITAAEIFFPDMRDMRIQADAQFYTTTGYTIPPAAYVWPLWTQPDSHSFLQINGQDVSWGIAPLFDEAHWHKYTVPYRGTGEPITFSIYDWYDNGIISNNYCHLPVCIVGPVPYGCTPGAWKRWTSAWPSSYPTDMKISAVFSNSGPYGDLTLLEGLSLKGGSTVDGKKEILLRAAIAGLLDEVTFGDTYPPYNNAGELIAAVNNALASNDKTSIQNLATAIDTNNNLNEQFCDLSAIVPS